MEKFDVESLIREAKIDAMRQLIDEGFTGGISTRSLEEILQDARAQGRDKALAWQRAGHGIR